MDFELDPSIAMLSRTPSVLDRLLRGLPETWLHANEGPESFSPFDVLGHLIHGDETDWIARARIILAHGESRAFDPFDRFAQKTASRGKSMGELLDRFTTLREENIAILRDLRLTPEQLRLTGRHPELGRVTLAELLATWVAHDLSHIGQIVRVMAKQYRVAVGPWEGYIPILRR